MAIPPVVARIFSGDSTSPLTRDGHGCPKLNAQSFARMRNNRTFIKRQGCLSVCAQGLCKDAKPTKHTQTLTLRKANGIMRFWEGWVCGEGLLSFCNGCGNREVRCNGRSKQGKDALACVPKGFARTQSQLSTHRRSPYEKRTG